MSKPINLWKNTPGLCEEIPTITYYEPQNKLTDATIVIFPGGGYGGRAEHEGKGYAEFFNENGISAFVVGYRVAPHSFPLPLCDARRAMRFVRFYADKYGIDKNKIAAMGSSAGGHLTALLSTYTKPIDFEIIDEIDNEEFLPNKQILCYPVINIYNKSIAHIGSGDNLIGNIYSETEDIISRKKLSPDLLVNETTPGAFIWHTADDGCVNVRNSLEYACALRDYSIDTELHVFPHGPHGIGIPHEDDKDKMHDAQWTELMLNWLKYIGWR